MGRLFIAILSEKVFLCERRDTGAKSAERSKAQSRQAASESARDLLLNNDFADSVSRSYYAIFQAARSLLALDGLESRKHSGVLSLFNRHYIKTGKLDKCWGVVLKDARRSREMADYTELAEFSQEDAEGQIADAEAFLLAVETFIAMSD